MDTPTSTPGSEPEQEAGAGPAPLQGRTPATDNSSWVEHAQKEKQQEPARLEETAKFLAGIISISLVVFISGKPAELSACAATCLWVAALVWIASAVLAFAVLFPWPYRYNKQSPDSIEQAWRRITRVKFVLLWLSVIAYLTALGLAVAVLFVGVGG